MTGVFTQWQCPNCGKSQTFGPMEEQVCERCGYSEEEPEQDGNKGFQ